jgi:hypothetical protein
MNVPLRAAMISLLFIFSGCRGITSLFLMESQAKEPTEEDTLFDERKKDWVQIYNNEVKLAVENNDADAYHFFIKELISEKTRVIQRNEKE